jgi:hypothetical protein
MQGLTNEKLCNQFVDKKKFMKTFQGSVETISELWGSAQNKRLKTTG